jgi:hypothetical protein
MPKIYICLPLSDKKSLVGIQLLVQQCACDVEIIGGDVAVKAIDANLVDCDGIIVILGQPLNELNALEPTISLANKHGKKIISIWPPHSSSSVLPQVLEKYGVALLTWDAKKLCTAVCDDEFEWVDAGGGTRAGSKTKRHKC